jgi:hypothetical protein
VVERSEIALKLKLATLGFILILTFCARQGRAQFDPGAQADAANPSGAPDPEKADQIWRVDPLTGALSVTIPFPTTPAGGRGPKIPFSLSYNSASTVTLQTSGTYVSGGNLNTVCNEAVVEQLSCVLKNSGSNTPAASSVLLDFEWSSKPLDQPQGPTGPWTTTGPFLYYSYDTMPTESITVDSNGNTVNQNGCTMFGPYIYVDENGGSHDLNLDNIFNVTLPGSGPCGNTSETSGYTLDGSDLLTSVNGASPVIYPDGTQLTTSPYALEDSNGNIATLSKDSLGRTPFSTTIPIGVAGPIPVGTYSVTTHSPTNASEAYSVVFSSIPIGSSRCPIPRVGPR